MSIRKNRLSVSWGISLLGLPVCIAILVVSVIIQNDINSSAAVYSYMMACFFMTLSFMFLNWLFALFSLCAKWQVLSLLERVKYIAIVLLFNGLAGYLTIKLWDKDGGSVISLNDKSKLDGFSVLCYVLLSISVLLPLFIAQRKFA